MILSLDHQQRLNLIALMGTQRGSVADIRALWSIQDRLELTAEEKTAIEYRVATQQGIETPSWNPERGLAPREFELSEAEGLRVRKIIDEWPHFLTAVDRKWILPLLEQLPEAAPQLPAVQRA